MATVLICCSPPECSIRTSSTRRQLDPGIRASVMPVMPRLQRATSRAIATWYPVPARDITFQVAILVLRRKSVAEPVFLPTILEVTPSLDGLWVTPVISTPLGGVGGWFDWLVEAGAETLVLVRHGTGSLGLWGTKCDPVPCLVLIRLAIFSVWRVLQGGNNPLPKESKFD